MQPSAIMMHANLHLTSKSPLLRAMLPYNQAGVISAGVSSYFLCGAGCHLVRPGDLILSTWQPHHNDSEGCSQRTEPGVRGGGTSIGHLLPLPALWGLSNSLSRDTCW